MDINFQSDNLNDIQLHIPDENTTLSVGVETLGADRFRLTNVPVGDCEWLEFGDVIEANVISKGTLQFVRRVERSPFTQYSFLLPKHVIESDAVATIRNHVKQIGGHSERVFGGMLFIAVPPGETWDPTPELERARSSTQHDTMATEDASMSNAIRIITPYRYEGTWVFDDPAVGLDREPFVSGIPEIIDAILDQSNGPVDRFRLLFSEKPFAGYQWEFLRTREEFDGNWYRLAEPAMEGWLCPALFKYFSAAPRRIYFRVEAVVYART